MLIWLRVSASGSCAVSQVESSNACGAPSKGEIGTPEMPFMSRHWSSTGFSDSKAGGGEVKKLSAFAGQN